LTSTLRAASQQLDAFQRALASLQRVAELYHTRSAIKDGAGTAVPGGPLAVELKDVTFGYGEGPPVLRGVAFRLAPGRVLGLLGRTGSGKSTIARLLFRFYDPQRGAVYLGGVDARAVRVAALRRRVALVTQEVQLFHGSVRDNLTVFDDGVPDSRLLGAIEALGLADWYRALSSGLDTEIAPHRLSAGEAQLLTLARAYLKDPGLVVLDEASSQLDAGTAARIAQALEALVGGWPAGTARVVRPSPGRRTAVIIAHRLETVRRVDQIVILESGRIVEQGERARLEADPHSRLSHLLRVGMEEVLR
jgi:ATP-binding cassette subfamily B protein